MNFAHLGIFRKGLILQDYSLTVFCKKTSIKFQNNHNNNQLALFFYRTKVFNFFVGYGAMAHCSILIVAFVSSPCGSFGGVVWLAVIISTGEQVEPESIKRDGA